MVVHLLIDSILTNTDFASHFLLFCKSIRNVLLVDICLIFERQLLYVLLSVWFKRIHIAIEGMELFFCLTWPKIETPSFIPLVDMYIYGHIFLSP